MYPGTFATTTPEKQGVLMADTGEALTYAELRKKYLDALKVSS